MNRRAPAKAKSYPVEQREERQQLRRASFPIVGVGASAGGLEAFTQLLKALPSRTGTAYVLVQHLDPTHESTLAELLARATELPVRQVTDAMPEYFRESGPDVEQAHRPSPSATVRLSA